MFRASAALVCGNIAVMPYWRALTAQRADDGAIAFDAVLMLPAHPIDEILLGADAPGAFLDALSHALRRAGPTRAAP